MAGRTGCWKYNTRYSPSAVNFLCFPFSCDPFSQIPNCLSGHIGREAQALCLLIAIGQTLSQPGLRTPPDPTPSSRSGKHGRPHWPSAAAAGRQSIRSGSHGHDSSSIYGREACRSHSPWLGGEQLEGRKGYRGPEECCRGREEKWLVREVPGKTRSQSLLVLQVYWVGLPVGFGPNDR